MRWCVQQPWQGSYNSLHKHRQKCLRVHALDSTGKGNASFFESLFASHCMRTTRSCLLLRFCCLYHHPLLPGLILNIHPHKHTQTCDILLRHTFAAPDTTCCRTGYITVGPSLTLRDCDSSKIIRNQARHSAIRNE